MDQEEELNPTSRLGGRGKWYFITLILAVILAVTIAALTNMYAYDDLLKEEWNAYKTKFNKQYSPEMDVQRLKVFLDTKLKIAQHNQRFYEGKESYSMGINKFADIFPSEMEMLRGLKRDTNEIKMKNAVTFIPPHEDTKYPTSMDWRKKGAVTPVKNQSNCGSCWAFSVTGALEGQHFRKTGKLVSLSVQNLIDCSLKNNGCDGGFLSRAFEYIKENKGIDTEESYPYTAKKSYCKFNKNTIGATVSGYVKIEPFNEEDLLKAVATVGPISVSIFTSSNLVNYDGSVLDERIENPLHVDHAVLIVGYGTTDDGKDYWLVKNSWGVGWGLKGYFMVARNINSCNIAVGPLYPLV